MVSSDTRWRLSLDQGGAWLRSWRADHGMTQSEIASEIGISQMHVSRLLTKSLATLREGMNAEE